MSRTISKKLNALNPFAERTQRAQLEKQIQLLLPALYKAARGITGHSDDAEDLVHDACIKALKSSAQLDNTETVTVKAWLNRILINTFRDNYRRSQRSPIQLTDHHATSSDDSNIVELAISAEHTPLQSMQNRNSSTAIQNAFSALPPEVRVVSVFFLVSGYSYQEIADITDCPIGTVMSRLSRGRQQLRKDLSEYHYKNADDQNDGSSEINHGDKR